MPSRIDGDLFVTGTMVAGSMTLPAACVTDTAVQAGTGIDATKLQHQHQITTPLCDHATSPAAKRLVMHKVYGATGEVVAFSVGVTVAAGAATTITVDLKKNGSSILTSTITVDNTTVAFDAVDAAGFTDTALVVGDVLEAEITAVSGVNLPKGVHAVLVLREDAE